MRKFLFSILVISALSTQICAQSMSIGLRLGYGMYFMKSLDDLQEFRREQTNLPLKTTESYPISPLYRLELANISEGFFNRAGVFYTFNSTGARSTLSDYSGRYDLDAIINGHQVGLVFEHLMKMKDGAGYGFYTDVAYLKTKLKTRDYLSLVYPTRNTYKEEYSFFADGFTIESGVYALISMKGIHFKIDLGFLLCFSEVLYLEDERDMKLYLHGDKVKPGWTGFRAGFQVDLTNHRFIDQ